MRQSGKPSTTSRNRRPDAPEALTLSPGAIATAAVLGTPDAALPEPPPEQQVQQVPLRHIVASPFQTREFNIPDLDDPDLIDLAASIRAQGVVSPVLLRPKGDLYELVIGERRYRASCVQSPDLDKFGPPPLYIPAIIRQLSDAEAAALLVIENLKRKDPHPFEEVKGVATLLDLHHGDQLAVAGVLGQTPHWVACRAHVHTNLSPEWKNAFLDPEGLFNHWTIAHFEEIAKLAPGPQEDLLRQFEMCLFDQDSMTVAELRGMIAKMTLTLDRAPFDPADDTLDPTAGACTTCRFNTLSTPFLFADEPVASIHKARCLDRPCYLGKCQRFLERAAAHHREQHPDLVLVVTSANPPRDEMPAAWRNGSEPVLLPHQFEKARKNAKDAIPAMISAGPGAGDLIFIKKPETRPEPQTSRNGSSLSSSSNGSASHESAPPPPPAERLAQLQAKFHNRRLSAMVDKTRDALKEFDGARLSFRTLLTLAHVFGTARNLTQLWTGGGRSKSPWSTFAHSLGEHDDQTISRRLWTEQLLPVLTARTQYNGPHDADRLTQEIPATLALIGQDVDALYREVVQALPDPKSWSQYPDYQPVPLEEIAFPRLSSSPAPEPEHDEGDLSEEPPFDIIEPAGFESSDEPLASHAA